MICKDNENPATRLTRPVKKETGEVIAALHCIDKGVAGDIDIVRSMTAGRIAAMDKFFTHFEATVARTKKWLDEVVIPSPDKILWLIVLPGGEVIGHYGFCKLSNGEGELDNLLRWEEGGRGIIRYVEVSLLSWMFGQGYHTSNGSLFKSNQNVVRLHEWTGHTTVRTHRLSTKTYPGGSSYYLDSDDGFNPLNMVDDEYLIIRLERDHFLKVHPWVKEVYSDDWRNHESS